MPIEVLSKVQFDQETRLHSIVEAGFKYQFPESLFTDFKSYILRYDLVSRWYKQLSDEDLVKVIRVSAFIN